MELGHSYSTPLHAASLLTSEEELAELHTSEQQSLTFALLATVCTQNTKDSIDAGLSLHEGGAGRFERSEVSVLRAFRSSSDDDRLLLGRNLGNCVKDDIHR